MQTLYASSFSLDTKVVSEMGGLYYSILKRNRPAQSFTSSTEGMRESQTINGHAQHTLVAVFLIISHILLHSPVIMQYEYKSPLHDE